MGRLRGLGPVRGDPAVECKGRRVRDRARRQFEGRGRPLRRGGGSGSDGSFQQAAKAASETRTNVYKKCLIDHLHCPSTRGVTAGGRACACAGMGRHGRGLQCASSPFQVAICEGPCIVTEDRCELGCGRLIIGDTRRASAMSERSAGQRRLPRRRRGSQTGGEPAAQRADAMEKPAAGRPRV